MTTIGTHVYLDEAPTAFVFRRTGPQELGLKAYTALGGFYSIDHRDAWAATRGDLRGFYPTGESVLSAGTRTELEERLVVDVKAWLWRKLRRAYQECRAIINEGGVLRLSKNRQRVIVSYPLHEGPFTDVRRWRGWRRLVLLATAGEGRPRVLVSALDLTKIAAVVEGESHGESESERREAKSQGRDGVVARLG